MPALTTYQRRYGPFFTAGHKEGSVIMPQPTPIPPKLETSASPKLEADVRRKLLAEDGLNFSSLIVRRVANGICLEGVLEVADVDADVSAAVRRIPGVTQVDNQLFVRNM